MECNANRLYSLEDTAEILGVSYDTVRRYIRHGQLSCARFSDSVVRVSGADIMGFYEVCKVAKAKEE